MPAKEVIHELEAEAREKGVKPSDIVRILDEVKGLGFQLFGLNPCVSHAYVRLVDFGKPVKLAGVEIMPGELIHADKHGVCLIPLDIAHKLLDACAEVEALERPLLEHCRSEAFDLEEYIRLQQDLQRPQLLQVHVVARYGVLHRGQAGIDGGQRDSCGGRERHRQRDHLGAAVDAGQGW